MINIVLVSHILVAVSSVIFGSYLLARPSRRKLSANYGLIGATIVSGTYLILATGSFMLSTCVTGLTFVSIAAVLSAFAERRLATQKIKL